MMRVLAAVAICSSAVAIAAAPAPTTGGVLASAWLTARLYGSDNHVAALRKVTITATGPRAYKVNIANQFGFTCDLTADANGDPAAVSNCVSSEAATYADRDVIALKCRTAKGERVCQGRFSLDSKYEYGDLQSGETKIGVSKFPGTITIARRLP